MAVQRRGYPFFGSVVEYGDRHSYPATSRRLPCVDADVEIWSVAGMYLAMTKLSPGSVEKAQRVTELLSGGQGAGGLMEGL